MEADEITEDPQATTAAKERSLMYFSIEVMQEATKPEDMLEATKPEDMLEATNPEDMLEATKPEDMLEATNAEDMLEATKPEDMLEATNPEDMLEATNPEDMLEASNPEMPLELSSSQMSIRLASEDLFVDSTSPKTDIQGSEDLSEQTPKTPSVSSQVSLKGQLSESLSKSSQSMTALEKAISEIPLEGPTAETHISCSIQLSSINDISMSSHNLSPDNVSQTQVPESEHFPKYSLSGPSTQVNKDTSAEQEEAGEDKLIVGTSTATAHAATPETPRSKKKKRVGGYTSRPVIPAKRAELMEVVKAMHREKFGSQGTNLFLWEKDEALKAIQTGLYIGWRCPHYLWDCFQIGDESKCFCGHLLKEHQIISDLSVPCTMSQCRCLMFCFIPSRPEEVGEFWLTRRATFDPKAWRAQCRCKHTHEEHAATGSHPCRHRGCSCNCFESNFLCAACDRRWEEHETFFETEETRRRGGRPYGTDTVNNS